MLAFLLLSLTSLAASSTILLQDRPDEAAARAEQEWDLLSQEITLKVLHHKENLAAGKEGLSFQSEIASLGRYFRSYRDTAPDYAWSARVFLAKTILADVLDQRREACNVLKDVVVQAPSPIVAGLAAICGAEISYALGDEPGIRQLSELYRQRKEVEEQFLQVLDTLVLRAALRPGRPFPDLTGTDLAGEAVQVRSGEAKVTLVFFFNAFHDAARSVFDRAVALDAEYRDRGLRIVGVSLDQEREDLEGFLRDRPCEFTVLWDGKGWESPLAKRVGVSRVPTSFMLDAKGNILHVDPPPAEIGALVSEVLQRPPPEEEPEGN
jgi:peroxiredoxin